MKTQKQLVIAGGSGFLGQSLQRYFQQENWKITVLTRKAKDTVNGIEFLQWDGQSLGDWTACLEGADAVINLSGKSVDCRYNERNKDLIYSSRLDSTRVLGLALVQCKNKPKLWINATSATIYRHAEDRAMTEANGVHGSGFSVDVCEKWERMFFSFDLPAMRKVAARTGIVFGTEGSALQPLTRLARMGLGGVHGSGSQMVSWLHQLDFCRAIEHIITHPELEGPVNITSPHPVTNHEMMRQLRRQVSVPFGLPMPAWMLSLGAVIIQTEPELLLKSRWVIPERLLQSGFSFQFDHIGDAMQHLLRRNAPIKMGWMETMPATAFA